jgi:hypothetical protein
MAGLSPSGGLTPGAGSSPKEAIPQRTRSSRALGRRIAAAELERWVTSGSSPAARASARASWKSFSCTSLDGSSGSSLEEKCDQMPVTVQLPSVSPFAARPTTSAH